MIASFENQMREVAETTDPKFAAASGRSVLRYFATPHVLSGLVDDLSAADVVELANEMFASQKSLSDFLGVGESTVAGWFKNGSIPNAAARALVAQYLARRLSGELESLEACVGDAFPVRDGETYLLVSVRRDDLDRLSGEVIARGISDEARAYRLAAAPALARSLQEALTEVKNYSQITEHVDRVSAVESAAQDTLLRTFAPEELRRFRKKSVELDEALNVLRTEVFGNEGEL